MKSKTAKSLKRRDTFFSGFQWGKKKKKSYIMKIFVITYLKGIRLKL